MRSGNLHEVIGDFHETQPGLQIRSIDSPRLIAESARPGITTSHNLSMKEQLLTPTGENPTLIQELPRHANLKVTMDTYVAAVSDEKRKAQYAGSLPGKVGIGVLAVSGYGREHTKSNR